MIRRPPRPPLFPYTPLFRSPDYSPRPPNPFLLPLRPYRIQNPPSDISSPPAHPYRGPPPPNHPAPTSTPSKSPTLLDRPNPTRPFESLPFRPSSARVLFRPQYLSRTDCVPAQTKPISRPEKFSRRQLPSCPTAKL